MMPAIQRGNCRYCGGMLFDGYAHDCPQEIAKSNLDKLTNTLHAIAVMFDLEVDEDLPTGTPEKILENIERSLNARCMASFLRGQRSAMVSQGRDADELPESLREHLRGILSKIQSETCISGYDSGHVGVEKLAREGLALLKIQVGQESHKERTPR